jgi:hypothetical protein
VSCYGKGFSYQPIIRDTRIMSDRDSVAVAAGKLRRMGSKNVCTSQMFYRRLWIDQQSMG